MEFTLVTSNVLLATNVILIKVKDDSTFHFTL